MQVIAVANQKGGAGKTTTALNLAYGLAARGKKVLLIDMDGQCNLSFLLGQENEQLQQEERQVYAVLTGKQPIASCIVKAGSVDLLPASPALYEADMTINQIGKEYKLREALKGIEGYDFVIIDTCPSLGILTVNAFTASNRVIIPVQAELLSLVGLQQLSETLDAIRTYCNSSLVIDGILVTRYQSRTRLSKDFLHALQQQAESLETKVYAQTIRESVTVKEAQSMRQSIFEYDAKAAAAKDYSQFVDEFLKGVSK
jgi:chromosome partitioning protein